MRAVLPSLSAILAIRSEIPRIGSVSSDLRNKKGKKKSRAYEGDEVFKISREVICSTTEEGRVVLSALTGRYAFNSFTKYLTGPIVTHLVMLNPNLSPSVFSIASRVLLSMLLALPQMSPTSVSSDRSLHDHVMRQVQAVCTSLSSGRNSMSKSLNLVIGATIAAPKHVCLTPHLNIPD